MKKRLKRSKQPVAREKTDSKKSPSEQHFEKDERVAYRFGMCDHGGEWAWSWDALAQHHTKLSDFETKTWNEIITKGSVGACSVRVANLPSRAQARLRKLKHDDTDELWELRVGNKPRFWGQRHGSCMCFIWWDEGHTVFPRNKK